MRSSRANVRPIIGITTFALLFTACGRLEVGLETTEVFEPQPVETEPAGGEGMQPTAGFEPAATESVPEPVHPASGLVFSNAEGTWWISWEGEVELLADVVLDDLSADGTKGLYIQSGPESPLGDVWMIDLASGERSQLTDTPQRSESSPRWIPHREDQIIFGSDTELGMANSMYPTVVGIDGSDYRILDATNGGFRGVSPDGSGFFYGGYEPTAQLFQWDDSGISTFDPQEFGLNADKLFEPEWSPQGDRVAWFVSGDFSGSGANQIGLAVFDLVNRTSQLMHTYQPLGGSSFNNVLAWSPDGEWLAFTTHNEPPATGRNPNLWVIRPDGGDERYLAEGSGPVWRYDSQYLAFQGLNEAQTEEVYLIDTAAWQVNQITELPLPERILYLLDWISP